MKRIILAAIAAFSVSTQAGEIIATMSGIRVAIISPVVAFGCRHVVEPYTTIHLSRDGTNYGTGWTRFTNKQGVVQEEQTCDYNVMNRSGTGDFLFMAPYRQFPKEAVEVIAIPSVGDTVNVAALTKGGAIQKSKVLVVDKVNSYVLLDYKAIPGDSESRVTTEAGYFVGFVSNAQQVGCTALIPGFSNAPTTPVAPVTPTVPTNQPPVVDPVVQAKAAGRAEAIQQIRDYVNNLK